MSSFNIPNNKDFYNFLKKTLGFRPKNKKLYQLAFIHKSATVIDHNGEILNNERLEFLGDTVLDTVISTYLYKKFPNFDEGLLTKTRSKIVNTNHLAFYAKKLKLDKFLIYNTKKKLNEKHLYADLLEALIGAIYLDRNFNKASNFIKKVLIDKYTDIEHIINTETNHKSSLLELSQKNNFTINFFTTLFDESKNIFLARVLLDGNEIAEAKGNTKKEAEQNAAFIAMKMLNPNYNGENNKF